MRQKESRVHMHAMLVSVSYSYSWSLLMNTSNMLISIGIIIPSQRHYPGIIHLLCTRPTATLVTVAAALQEQGLGVQTRCRSGLANRFRL